MKQLIEQHQMELKELLPEFDYKGCNKQTILNWHKQSLKQFIDGLIAREEGDKMGAYVETTKDKVLAHNKAKEETIAHLKELKEELN